MKRKLAPARKRNKNTIYFEDIQIVGIHNIIIEKDMWKDCTERLKVMFKRPHEIVQNKKQRKWTWRKQCVRCMFCHKRDTYDP